ncbi:DUF4010 domain-containing protein [Novosphingobium sp. 1949]|uniref:DUF4010 domain-containing protein n=1 Tax=Novosphingobium organovorum TaxID=2930092 RepID=A0ABT0B9I9_9SPHN|nr:DUF4010 domain-containing protein [Novosphingobium organovorum]MCJ2181721.1 DUF4010 domain-containing protein [Novosphingobium organovorum]
MQAQTASDAVQIALGLQLLAALGAGLLIGIERGWRQRAAADGTRVAGVRTFTLIGGAGGLAAVLALQLSQALGAVFLAAMAALLLAVFLRPRACSDPRDATSLVAALLTLGLGALAGGGYTALALALAALATLLLSARQQAHSLLAALTQEELRALVRYAVLAVGVLPFLPNRDMGPYLAWNPFKLWLVVLLITGFSIAGYIARRLIGPARGTLATAAIGGAYSSTAVTTAFSSQLREGGNGPLATGIALASTIMYARVLILASLLAPAILPRLALLLGPALASAALATLLVWRREENGVARASAPESRPFELVPALGFLLAVAGAALLVRWSQANFGGAGGGLSLFLAGSVDVDAAMVAYSTLPSGAVPDAIAALALAGTVASNMAFKAGIVFTAAGRAGNRAGLALLSSLGVLLASLAFAAFRLL